MARWVKNTPVVNATARARGTELVRTVSNGTAVGGRRLAKRGTHRHGSGRGVTEPRMADSIVQSWHQGAWEVSSKVTATANWSATMALGSRAHRIPKSGLAKPLMKFKWPRGQASPRLRRKMTRTQYFLFTRVRHPGNKKPNRFLQTPLALYGRRSGFKVTIKPNSRSYLP